MNARILVIALVSVFASAMAFATGGAKDAHGKKPVPAKKKGEKGGEHHDEHGDEHHDDKAAH